MIVWFHSIMNQDRYEDDSFNYDSMMDSKLFASLSLCERDAIDCYQMDLEHNALRYNDALRRYDIAKEALAVLEANEVDVSELYWMNYAAHTPEFQEPGERYIYSIEVIE